MADTLASGASARKGVGVQIPPRPPQTRWARAAQVPEPLFTPTRLRRSRGDSNPPSPTTRDPPKTAYGGSFSLLGRVQTLTDCRPSDRGLDHHVDHDEHEDHEVDPRQQHDPIALGLDCRVFEAFLCSETGDLPCRRA